MEYVAGHAYEVRGERWVFDLSGRLITPTDPPAYDPCWCGSGHKFRFCHMRRHLEPKANAGEWIALFEKADSLQVCLHPAAPVDCHPRIVAAHSIQRRGGGLKTLARDGNVYGFKHHITFLEKNQGRLIPELIGIAKASTFYGFCETHDGSLFRAAEAAEFAGTSDQILRLNFRTVARQLHSDIVAAAQVPLLAKIMDRGRSPQEQRMMFVMLEYYRRETEALLAQHQLIKGLYDGDLLRNDDAAVNALVVRLAGGPEYMCSGVASLDFDFNDQPLQGTDDQSLSVYTVATPGGYSVVLSWREKDSAAEALANSLVQLEWHRIPDAVTRYVFEHIDNIYFAPEWWDSLTGSARDALLARINRRIYPFYRRDTSAVPDPEEKATATAVERLEAVGTWSRTATFRDRTLP